MAGTYTKDGKPIQGPGLGWHNDWYNPNTGQIQNTPVVNNPAPAPAPAPASSGYGTDPNFHYSGWGQDFGYGPSGLAAYEAYKNSQGQGFNTPEGNWYQGSQGEYNAEIDNAYNAGMGYWNTAEENLGKNLDLMKGQAQSDQEANIGELGANKKLALTNLEKQKRAGETEKEDAFAAARRLWQELQQGARQRFGGSTSAGQAISEIQGSEMQRQMGQTWRQANEFGQQIMGAVNNVEEQYNSGVLKIKQATQQALTNAQLEFNNSITQIAAGKAQTEQEKSQARLNALMDLRNKAFTIQQQDQTFRQQLETMKQQQLLNIDAYKQTSGNAVNQGQNAYSTFQDQTNQGIDYSQVGAKTQQATNPLVGQITSKFKDPREYLTSGSIANYLTGN